MTANDSTRNTLCEVVSKGQSLFIAITFSECSIRNQLRAHN